MAFAKKCDRCGKFYETREIEPDIRILIYKHGYGAAHAAYADHCDDCQKELESFIGYSKSKKKGE